MKALNLHRPQLRTAALLAVLTLGVAAALPTLAQAGAAHKPDTGQPAVVQDDVLLFDAVPGAVYLNGGIGLVEQKQMRKDARNWPLRMTFSDRPNNEFVAGVEVKVLDENGKALLRLKDGGPMTYVQVPPGEYRISALYKGETLNRMVHVGPNGADVNFHWPMPDAGRQPR